MRVRIDEKMIKCDDEGQLPWPSLQMGLPSLCISLGKINALLDIGTLQPLKTLSHNRKGRSFSWNSTWASRHVIGNKHGTQVSHYGLRKIISQERCHSATI